MNTIISVHQQDLKNIEVVYTTVYSAVTALRPVEWPEVFTVRHLIPGSPTVSYTFRPNFRKNYVDVDYCMEGSAVFNDGFVPSFHFRFHDANDLSQHGNPILQTPKDPFVDEWLRQPNPQITGGLSSTYRYLQVLYFMCSTVFSYFPECFNLQSESNHERKYAALGNMINIAKVLRTSIASGTCMTAGIRCAFLKMNTSRFSGSYILKSRKALFRPVIPSKISHSRDSPFV